MTTVLAGAGLVTVWLGSIWVLVRGVKGDLRDPLNELHMVQYIGGTFGIAVSQVLMAGLIDAENLSGPVGLCSIVFMGLSMFGITYAVIEAIIERENRKHVET